MVGHTVHWRCWLGGRKGIRPVKNWVVGCWYGYLSVKRVCVVGHTTKQMKHGRSWDIQIYDYRLKCGTRANWWAGGIFKYHTYIHINPFNGRLSGTSQVSRYQKGKTNVDFNEARGSEWQLHQLGHMQVCTSLQTDNHASTPPLSFFTGRMPFLPPNQQRQGTEGSSRRYVCKWIIHISRM